MVSDESERKKVISRKDSFVPRVVYLKSKLRRLHEYESRLYLKRTEESFDIPSRESSDVEPALKEIPASEIGTIEIAQSNDSIDYGQLVNYYSNKKRNSIINTIMNSKKKHVFKSIELDPVLQTIKEFDDIRFELTISKQGTSKDGVLVEHVSTILEGILSEALEISDHTLSQQETPKGQASSPDQRRLSAQSAVGVQHDRKRDVVSEQGTQYDNQDVKEGTYRKVSFKLLFEGRKIAKPEPIRGKHELDKTAPITFCLSEYKSLDLNLELNLPELEQIGDESKCTTDCEYKTQLNKRCAHENAPNKRLYLRASRYLNAILNKAVEVLSSHGNRALSENELRDIFVNKLRSETSNYLEIRMSPDASKELHADNVLDTTASDLLTYLFGSLFDAMYSIYKTKPNGFGKSDIVQVYRTLNNTLLDIFKTDSDKVNICLCGGKVKNHTNKKGKKNKKCSVKSATVDQSSSTCEKFEPNQDHAEACSLSEEKSLVMCGHKQATVVYKDLNICLNYGTQQRNNTEIAHDCTQESVPACLSSENSIGVKVVTNDDIPIIVNRKNSCDSLSTCGCDSLKTIREGDASVPYKICGDKNQLTPEDPPVEIKEFETSELRCIEFAADRRIELVLSMSQTQLQETLVIVKNPSRVGLNQRPLVPSFASGMSAGKEYHEERKIKLVIGKTK